jgi:hypothetical protein
VNENLTQYITPNKKRKRGPQPHPAEDHKKNSNNREKTHAPTDTQEPINSGQVIHNHPEQISDHHDESQRWKGIRC